MGNVTALQFQDRWIDEDVPSVFCWTKMGAEAGQSLDDILRRKELERLAGKGTFCWGIGNSLGRSVQKALKSNPKGIEILFSPMKSKAKKIDESPNELSLWTAYLDESGKYVDLPEHMVITSRRHSPSGVVKSSHYALLCLSDTPITQNQYYGELDAARAVNYMSQNALGASQVTAMVSYHPALADHLIRPYPIHFRATMHNMGFVKLGLPVPIHDKLKKVYRELLGCKVNTQWRFLSRELKTLAQEARIMDGSLNKQTRLF